MKGSLNLASPRNRAQHLTATIARRLLPVLVCWLACLLIAQGLALHRRRHLAEELTGLAARVKAVSLPASGPLSAGDYKRQAADLSFADSLIAKDRFSWTDLLDRLEGTLTRGVTLTRIEPDYKERSLRLAGMAENVEALQRYLSSLLHSDSLSAAYLLGQETKKIKDSHGREQAVVVFQVEIKEAFK
jgi:hypothetical protein